jgi:hypothetical protein
MSYYLSPADAWEALSAIDSTKAEAHRAAIIGACAALAADLADALGIRTTGADLEPEAFGGMLLAFEAREPGQLIPEAIAGCDDEDAWYVLPGTGGSDTCTECGAAAVVHGHTTSGPDSFCTECDAPQGGGA